MAFFVPFNAFELNEHDHKDKLLYLTAEFVQALHDYLILKEGGKPGLLSIDRLESALAAPKWHFHEGEFEKAAALLYALANDHAFVDGNKRTALHSMDIFLAINSIRFSSKYPEVQGKMMAIFVENHVPKERLVKWIKKHSKKLHWLQEIIRWPIGKPD